MVKYRSSEMVSRQTLFFSIQQLDFFLKGGGGGSEPWGSQHTKPKRITLLGLQIRETPVPKSNTLSHPVSTHATIHYLITEVPFSITLVSHMQWIAHSKTIQHTAWAMVDSTVVALEKIYCQPTAYAKKGNSVHFMKLNINLLCIRLQKTEVNIQQRKTGAYGIYYIYIQ